MKKCLLFFFLISNFLTAATPSNKQFREELPNGFRLFIEECDDPTNTIQVKLFVDVGLRMENDTEQGLTAWLLASLLHGTVEYDREDTSTLLSDAGMDILPVHHIELGIKKSVLSFEINTEQIEMFNSILKLTQQLAVYATLNEEDIELARDILVDSIKRVGFMHDQKEVESLLYHISNLTQKQLKSHYETWFRTDNMCLFVKGPIESKAVRAATEELFEHLPAPTEPFPDGYRRSKAEVNALLKEIYKPNIGNGWFSSSGKEVVIDNKIYMREPASYQSRWWHRLGLALGLAATGGALGFGWFGGMLAYGGAGTMITLIFSGLCWHNPCLMDPQVLQEKRAEDLRYGFRHAYNYRRLGYTLTPYERRNMYILESTVYAKQGHFCIQDLEFYNLTLTEFQEMLYTSELRQLHGLKQDFIATKNNHTRAKEKLLEELNQLMLPYKLIRDKQLEAAREEYEDNPFVIHKRKLKRELEEAKAALWKQHDKGKITLDEVYEKIAVLQKETNTLLNSQELVAEIKKAKRRLKREQDTIHMAYLAKEQEVKVMIGYGQRMARIEEGIEGINRYYSAVLYNTLYQFPINDPNFVDYIDLR